VCLDLHGEALGEKTRCHTTRASILASITVDGAYFAAYPYIRTKAACISSDSSALKLSVKEDRNLQ
jgi:secreted trypsin-like serine protease